MHHYPRNPHPGDVLDEARQRLAAFDADDSDSAYVAGLRWGQRQREEERAAQQREKLVAQVQAAEEAFAARERADAEDAAVLDPRALAARVAGY